MILTSFAKIKLSFSFAETNFNYKLALLIHINIIRKKISKEEKKSQKTK